MNSDKNTQNDGRGPAESTSLYCTIRWTHQDPHAANSMKETPSLVVLWKEQSRIAILSDRQAIKSAADYEHKLSWLPPLGTLSTLQHLWVKTGLPSCSP